MRGGRACISGCLSTHALAVADPLRAHLSVCPAVLRANSLFTRENFPVPIWRNAGTTAGIALRFQGVAAVWECAGGPRQARLSLQNSLFAGKGTSCVCGGLRASNQREIVHDQKIRWWRSRPARHHYGREPPQCFAEQSERPAPYNGTSPSAAQADTANGLPIGSPSTGTSHSSRSTNRSDSPWPLC